ncbi:MULTISPECIES: DUF3110 domain-containing protein [unclassified Microcystis]|uniref:DUF3110 domain-containing protein n=1 Tax=unclassified Microcystis TaxID=2643300 RepID=UPI001197BE39|nr:MULTISPECIES: DUF3110 domain-containing protein [unclassified Microcystis]MCA2926878.1 DUF3110 domain-containing protein [Microcystis sp. M020S1]MCA2935473.1 DUF3110 domain-containing protein [Microcystis sp. M015S1]MCA2620966.1 DUF3110 domain-containing protein [Microcystis sp. M099S2]MCA2650489.1 DUF3110 domain-containing protein [Microcystis sp. M065S2]MCA2679133.1 DUF3110 domain-containing protein [Microcystis sp. M043S2]
MASVGFDFNYKIAITLDGAWVLFRQEPNLLVVTDSVTGQQVNTLKLRSFKYRRKNIVISGVAKSINQLWLIFVYEDNTFDEWFLAQIFAENKEKQSNPPFIYRAVSQNGQWALRETKRKCFQLHNLKTNQVTPIGYRLLPQIEENDEYFWKKIILSNDAEFLVTSKFKNDSYEDADLSHGLRLINLQTQDVTPLLLNYQSEIENINTFSISEDSQTLLVGIKHGNIASYRLRDSQKFGESHIHQSTITFIFQKFIEGNLITVAGSYNGEVLALAKYPIYFKLENLTTLAFLTPDNKHLIIGELLGNSLTKEQYNLFEIIEPQDNLEKNQVTLPSKEIAESEKEKAKEYYVLTANVGTKREGIHTLRQDGKLTILLFESFENASFFNQHCLQEQGFLNLTAEKNTKIVIENFCKSSGYSWEIIPEGKNILIEKELHYWGIARQPLEPMGIMYGPGWIVQKFYIDEQLFFERDSYLEDSSGTSLFPMTFAPSVKIWKTDLKGYTLFIPPSKHICYKIKLTVSPLIVKDDDWRSYVHYNVAFEDVPSKGSRDFAYRYSTDEEFESRLLAFLDFQERLFGKDHEQLIKTFDKLIEVYEAEGKDNEKVEEIIQRKLELDKLYEPQQIILSSEGSTTNTFRYFRLYRISLNFLILLLNIDYLAAILLLEEKSYTIAVSRRSYIDLRLSPDKIVNPQLLNNNINKISDFNKLNAIQQINDILAQIITNVQLTIEPDINTFQLLKRIWNDIKLLFHKFDFQEDGQYLIHKIKTSQLSRQLKKFLKNPNNISHPAILVTFIIPVILLFIIGQYNNFSFTFKEIILTQNPLLLLRELISIFCFSFFTIVVLGSLAITPILIMFKLFNIDIITSYFTNKLSEREQKWLIFPTISFIPLYLLTFLIITISAIFVGISLTKKIAIDWTMKLATQPYWLIIISIGFLTWLGDLGEWILRKQRYRLSNTAAAIVGAIVANLLGNYLNQIFGKHFDPNSLLFNSSLAAVGGYGGATQDRKNKNFIGALGAALASVYFINKYPLQVFSLITPSIEALSEKILYLIGLLIGILSGGFIGGFVGLLIGFFLATLFAFATFYFSFGVYHLAQQVTNDFQERGYSKTFTSIILMIITLFGSAFGLILSLIF